MKTYEVECVLWCGKCGEEKAEIQRRPTTSEHVFQHVTEPHTMSGVTECPDCQHPLERR